MIKNIFCNVTMVAILFAFQSCDLFESVSKKEELPPATQEGKHTFGCYVNGELWLPKAKNYDRKLNLSYDPTFNKGTFDLRAVRYLNDVDFQYIIHFSDSLSSTGVYSLQQDSNQVVTFSDPQSCYYSLNDADVKSSGSLEVTRFDLQKGIISGKFEFILIKPSCDTIRITEGRFDMEM